MISAIVVPIATFAIGNFLYFTYAGFRRRRWWLVALGFGYTAACWSILLFGVSDDTDIDTPMDDFFFTLFFTCWMATILHGVVVALSNDSSLRRNQREQARQFAYLQPEQASRLGVGRPDLARDFGDGGLLDLNNAPGHELARLPGFDPQIAHRIVVERSQRSPFVQPEELVTRGIVTTRQLHRVGGRLICLPPMATTSAQWMPTAAFDAVAHGMPGGADRPRSPGSGETPGFAGTGYAGAPGFGGMSGGGGMSGFGGTSGVPGSSDAGAYPPFSGSAMQTPPPDPAYPEPSDPWSESAG
jgi:uncharacterized membrane protein YgcG